MNRSKTYWFGLLGVIFFIVASFLGGLQLEDYSHISQLISEAYATGTPYGLQLRYLGFLPSGIFIAVFALYAGRILAKSTFTKLGFAGIGIFYGIATIIVKGKYISYLGIVCSITTIIFVGVFLSDLHSNFIGLYQRIIEGSILTWIVVCSLYL